MNERNIIQKILKLSATSTIILKSNLPKCIRNVKLLLAKYNKYKKDCVKYWGAPTDTDYIY